MNKYTLEGTNAKTIVPSSSAGSRITSRMNSFTNSKVSESRTSSIILPSTKIKEMLTQDPLRKNLLSWQLLKSEEFLDENEKTERDGEGEWNRNSRRTIHAKSVYNENQSNCGIFPERSGSASALYEDSIYVFGGYRSKIRLNDMYKYDIINNTWNRIRCEYTPSPRENSPAVVYRNKMYIYGGYEGNKKWLKDFFCFNMDTQLWTRIHPKKNSLCFAPSALFGFALAVDEPSAIIYFFGGYNGANLNNNMYAYHIKKNKWLPIQQSGEIPSPRSCTNAHICDGYFYLFGGYDGQNSLNSTHQFHLNTGVWTTIKYHTGIENEEDDYAKRIQNRKSTEPISSKWTSSKSTIEEPSYNSHTIHSEIPKPRYFCGSFLHNKCIYILGGYNGYSKRLNDFYKFDIYQRTWTKIETRNNFSGRSSMNLHIYKNVVYCIGGFDGEKVLSDVYALKLENVYIQPSTLRNDYALMVNNPRYSDVVFVLQNRYAYACKAILSARCPFFSQLFSSYFAESRLPYQNVPIPINDVSYDVFWAILHYLYVDELPNHIYDQESYILLLLAAIKFNISRLIQLCEMEICNYVNKYNVLDITIFSYKNNCQQLCKFCLDFLINNGLLDGKKINRLVTEPQLLAEISRRSLLDS